MFPRLRLFLAKLIPSRVTRHWNANKAFSAMAVLAMVFALIPLPRDLPNSYAVSPALVTDVTSTASDLSFGVGSVITVQVTFDDTVYVVSGTPQIALNTGGIASYTMGSGGTVLSFDYTVASGENIADLDYTSTLALSGGDIEDGATMDADYTLPAPGGAGSISDNQQIVVDTTAPVITEVIPVNTPTNTQFPLFKINYLDVTAPGTLFFSGDCSGVSGVSILGDNVVQVGLASVGLNSNCVVTAQDSVVGTPNVSAPIVLTSFFVNLAASDFSVNSINDDVDDDVGDGICHTALNECTLRAALDEANFTGSRSIGFDPLVFASQQTISLVDDPLLITADDIVINGLIVGNEVKVIIDGTALTDSNPDSAACTVADSKRLPILKITSDSSLVYGLGFIKSLGNAIEIVGGDENKIESNWIGTIDRENDVSPEGNAFHGICVAAASSPPDSVQDTSIKGNVIVGSGHDGIRLEGTYVSQGGVSVNETLIINNLIGNLRGTDTAVGIYNPGNTYSGITTKITNGSIIARNIITNNGNTAGTAVGDGVSIMETFGSLIAENYVGTTQPAFADRGVEDFFPLPTDSNEQLDIGSMSPTAGMNEYTAAPNGCDGISIRYFDHLNPLDGSGSSFAYTCPETSGVVGSIDDKPNNDSTTYFGATLGPSVGNFISANEVGYNGRNGMYIQSLACLADAVEEYSNLPNIMAGIPSGSGSQFQVQSIQNRLIQNSIFRNDGTDTNGTAPFPGSGTYGIGIDLEDFATATLATNVGLTSNYWSRTFPDSDRFNCENISFPVLDGVYVLGSTLQPGPVNTDSAAMDLNITENDDYDNEPSDDVGTDPDAGANRLVNHPIVESALSSADGVVVRGSEGSWVEIFQVVCPNGTVSDAAPTKTDSDIRATCDTDYWNEQDATGIEDHHTAGHGQGFRFLGSGFIPADPDPGFQGYITIDPTDFFLDDGNANNDVHPFHGGLVVATATGLGSEALCWDVPNDPACDDQVFPPIAPAGVGAQRAGSVGVGGLWVPQVDTGTSCYENSDGPDFVPFGFGGLNLEFFTLYSCLGSTSEFSPAAFVGDALYTLEKTQSTTTVAPGGTVDYTITLTNTGATFINVFPGGLSDPLPTTIDSVVSCNVDVIPVSGPSTSALCDPNTLPDPINNVGPLTLFPGDQVVITITGHVKTTIVDAAECSFQNTVFADEDFILGPNFTLATEVGSLSHVTSAVTVTPCPSQTGTGSLEKQISVNGGAFADADTAGTAVSSQRGETVSYLVHFTNSTGAGASTNVSDTFPVQLSGSPSSLTCWLDTGDTRDAGPDSGDTVVPCTYIGAPTYAFDFDAGVAGATPLLIPNGQTLHILVSGYSVDSALITPGPNFCNTVTVLSANSTFTDAACTQVLDPASDITMIKTVSNATPAAGSTLTYTLQVTNNSSVAVNNVQIVDDLGDAADDLIPRCVATSADILSASGGVSSTIVGNVVTWTIGTLAASGGSTTVSVNVRLRADLADGTTCRNIATASGTNVTSVQDDATINVPTSVGQTTVTLEKEATNDNGGSDDPDIFELGDTVEYQVTVRNTGSAAISNLTVRDSIPEEEEDLGSVVATSGAVNNSELSNDRLEVGAISISAGASQTVDYEVSVLDEGDFPLDNYDLDEDAEMEDGDFYPEDVEDDDIGSSSSYDDPEDALDAPDGNFVSLGEDGEITVSTSDEDETQGKLIVDGDGDDFCIMELDSIVDTDGTSEEYEVEVSQTDNSSDFESVGSSESDSNCFDLGDADLTWARFVRIIDTSGTVRGNAPGSDIDAVCLLNLGGFVTNTAGLYNGSSLVTTADETILVDFTDAFENPLDERDCQPVKEMREPAPTPVPTPVPPYVPVPHLPLVPFTGLPTTGPESAALPLVSSLVLGMIGWMVRKRQK